MARWGDVELEAPELAARVRARFEANRHQVLATLRADGSPRQSGMECRFSSGDPWLGMMPGSRKALDLRRDPRMSLHSATVDPEMVDGDARVSGRAGELFDPDRFAEVFPSEASGARGAAHQTALSDPPAGPAPGARVRGSLMPMNHYGAPMRR